MAPFFSAAMVKTYSTGIWLLGSALLLFWPKKAFYMYFQAGLEPFCTNGIYMAGIVILSYISLRCGRGELAQETDPITRKKNKYHEENRNFFSYGLISFITHTLFFICLLLPFFLIAGLLSGSPIRIFFQYLVILFLTALLFRLIGFSAYMCVRRWHNFSYILTRFIFVFFFFLSSKFISALNPLSMVHSLSKTSRMPDAFTITGSPGYLTIVAGLSVSLILLNAFIVSYKTNKWIRR